MEPFDDAYLKEKDIKHMSFHAYLRKIRGFKKSSLNRFPLENISCKIKKGCNNHRPWPQGICDKCRPSDITLNRQNYRHIDNISFENNLLVSRFIDYWRTSGHQRIGFLFGNYEEHLDVPLGIRGVTAAIYEPPQISMTQHSIELLEDAKSALVDQLAECLGLKRIGWIFTDLTPDPQKSACVKYTRNKDTYFLSAEECITAGYFQNQYLNSSKYCTDGYFGSKFATVILTGDNEQQIQPFGYQVSNQCASLVEGQCLVPTKDAPELAYAKESSQEQYVPAVYYVAKDEYGNDVRKIGQPLPVEYLIIDVPASMPIEQRFFFTAKNNVDGFPIENRTSINQNQNTAAVSKYCSQFNDNDALEMFSDFHFLLYLLTNETLAFSINDITPLCEAVKTKNCQIIVEWASSNEKWAMFKDLLAMNEEDFYCRPILSN
uniref:MPN domain-containing protein n=1 Tax=Romanomermis culicivorax TaxID=13658 RepID=A0A915IGU7_ROMCU